MNDHYKRIFAAVVFFSLVTGTAFGQGFRPGGGGPGGRGGPGGGGRGGPGRLESSGLKTGSPMPEVSVFDAEGKPFETTSLKGKYSVIVFGCLT